MRRSCRRCDAVRVDEIEQIIHCVIPRLIHRLRTSGRSIDFAREARSVWLLVRARNLSVIACAAISSQHIRR